ncbi:MAG: hypothetical protein GC159_06695 [Phycisphaera sp.]|nr:hypothetical protein [Phycisphaera sp.]
MILLSSAPLLAQEPGKGERVVVDSGLGTGGKAALIIFIILGIAVVVMGILLWTSGQSRRTRAMNRTGIRRY